MNSDKRDTFLIIFYRGQQEEDKAVVWKIREEGERKRERKREREREREEEKERKCENCASVRVGRRVNAIDVTIYAYLSNSYVIFLKQDFDAPANMGGGKQILTFNR